MENESCKEGRGLPSEFFLERAVSATESSLRLAFMCRPLFVASEMKH